MHLFEKSISMLVGRYRIKLVSIAAPSRQAVTPHLCTAIQSNWHPRTLISRVA